VLEHGGEVLRFIGDASLAVFPVTDQSGETRRGACGRAILAARAARERGRAANERRTGAGLQPFSFGVGLHLGRVLYGNIGTPDRLEFSVIGAAANETARIEALCKETQRDVVLSRQVAVELSERWPSLGSFELRGVQRPVEVFALP
jgi:adenylate cyclase